MGKNKEKDNAASEKVNQLLDKARAAIDRDELSEARAYLERAVELMPQSSRAWRMLGYARRWLGDHNGAVEAYRRLIALDGGSALAHASLAGTLADSGQLLLAEEGFRRSLAIEPRSDAYLELGQTLQRLERWKEAEEAYRSALKLDPDEEEAMYHLAGMIRIGNPGEAERLLRKALQRDPEYSCAYRELGILCIDKEQYGNAEELLRRAIELGDDTARVHWKLGRVLALSDREELGVEEYRTSLSIEPRAERYVKFGITLSELDRFREADEAFRAALELDPENKDAMYYLGINLTAKHPAEAERLFRRVIEIDPQHELAWAGVGSLLARRGEYIEAEEKLRRAIELEDDSGARVCLGLVLWRQNRNEEAEPEYLAGCRLDPGSSVPVRFLGDFYWGVGRLADAEQAYRKAVELGPNEPINACRLAEFLFGNERIHEAERWLNRTLTLDPTHKRGLKLKCRMDESSD